MDSIVKRPVVWWVCAAVLLVVLLPLVVYVVPSLLAHDSGKLPTDQHLKAEADARTSMAQAIGAVGLVGTLLFTAQTFLLSRTSHLTGRYESGIKQLGDSDITVRIGGIYGLEQLIGQRKDIQQAILDVLSSFVRGQAAQGAGAQQPVAGDVQAAVVVLGRGRGGRVKTRPLDLHGVDLTGADLQRASLHGVSLGNAGLDGANCTDASFEGATLREARMRKANLSAANFRNADLTEVDLSGATLYQTDFSGATVVRCRVVGCDLSQARNLTTRQRAELIT